MTRPADRVTAKERAAIADWMAAHGVTRCERHVSGPVPEPVDWDRLPRGSAQAVRHVPYQPPQSLSVQAALEWAFAVERASMDVDEIAASTGGARRARGVEAMIAERASLGAVSIDTSPGRSEPADEAQEIASLLRHALPWRDAVWLADLARARSAPDLLDHMVPRMQPVGWVHGRGGPVGRKVDLAEGPAAVALGLPVRGGWPEGACTRRNRKGVVVRDPIPATPVRSSITVDMIARARRLYLDWWGHLLTVRVALGARIGRIEITDEMPDMTPWRGTEPAGG